jgi:DNA-binding transcriptional ArsR family regulator
VPESDPATEARLSPPEADPQHPQRRPATLEEGRALAHPVRLRILRLCIDQALTNKDLATRLELQPATVLHHVRTLVATGFLAPEESRPGRRGSTEKPYRATSKSWWVDPGDIWEAGEGQMAGIDATRAELADAGDAAIVVQSRLGIRLSAERRDQLAARLDALAEEYAFADDPGGQPVALYVLLHKRRL